MKAVIAKAVIVEAVIVAAVAASAQVGLAQSLDEGVAACESDARGKEDRYAFPKLIGGKKGEDCLRLTRKDGRGDTFIVEAKASKGTAWRPLGRLFVHSRARVNPFGGLATLIDPKEKHEDSYYVQATQTEIMVLKALKGQKMVAVFSAGTTPRAEMSCRVDGLTANEIALCKRVIDPMKAARGELSVLNCTGELGDGYEAGLCARIDATEQALLRADKLGQAASP